MQGSNWSSEYQGRSHPSAPATMSRSEDMRHLESEYTWWTIWWSNCNIGNRQHPWTRQNTPQANCYVLQRLFGGKNEKCSDATQQPGKNRKQVVSLPPPPPPPAVHSKLNFFRLPQPGEQGCRIISITLKCTLGWKILVLNNTVGGTSGYCTSRAQKLLYRQTQSFNVIGNRLMCQNCFPRRTRANLHIPGRGCGWPAQSDPEQRVCRLGPSWKGFMSNIR